MRDVLILKTGSTVPGLIARRGDFEDWFRQGLGLQAPAARVVAADDGPLPGPEQVAAVVVTGSAAMVTDRLPWSLRAEAWLRELVAREVPVLGVCYGHQLLAQALGGRVADNPRGREIGTVHIALTRAGVGHPLFAGLPSQLTVQATHCQSVLDPPPGAVVLGGNDHDPCQAIAFGPRAFGVQFHPEFDADIVRGYLSDRGAALLAEGFDPEALDAAAEDSDHGRAILQNFAELL